MELKIDKHFIDEAVQKAVEEIKQNFIPLSVLNDIKAEIKAVAYDDFTATDGLTECWICNLDEVLEIIDKHMAESVEK